MNDMKQVPEGWTNFGKALSHYAKASIDEAAWDQTWNDFLHLMENEDLTVDEALVSATHSSLSGSRSPVGRAVAAVRRQKRTVLATCTGMVGVALFFLGQITAPATSLSEESSAGSTGLSMRSRVLERAHVLPSPAELEELIHSGGIDTPIMKATAKKLMDYFDLAMMTMVEDEEVASYLRTAIPIVGSCPSLPAATPWLETALRSPSLRIRRLAKYYYPKINPKWTEDPRTLALMESSLR